jgi:hypothetical protein
MASVPDGRNARVATIYGTIPLSVTESATLSFTERGDLMVDPDDRQRASAAAAALADIEQQQLFVTQRLGGFSWLAPVVAVVLALAAASLAYRTGAQGYGDRMRQMDVRFVVVQVIYLAAFIPLVGTPVRTGVIPRDGRQRRRHVFALCVVLVLVPQLAMLGPWWTAIGAGAGAGVAVVVLSRWRLAATLREARRPPLVDHDGQHPVTDRIVAVPAVVVIAVMCAGVLASASPDRVFRTVGSLAYFLGIGSLFVVQQRIFVAQQRIGVLPPELRAGLVGKALLFGVALWIPVMLTMFFTSLRGNWWVASCCALAAVLTVSTIYRWQHNILRHQARAAGPTPLEGAHG